MAATLRTRLLSSSALGAYTANARAAQLIGESVGGSAAAALRNRLIVAEATVDRFANPNLRSRFTGVEATIDHNAPPNLRSRLCVVESLQAILEPIMSTEVFPGVDPNTGQHILKGLAFDVTKKPMFSNKIVEHTSGEETATSYWENPKWEYTVTYDYLPDKPVTLGNTDLHTLMGFFLRMRGRFDTWLFSDPDDYQVTVGFQRDFDGSVVDFNLVRGISGFYEPVGQYDALQGLSVWLSTPHAANIPVSPGPYTITVTNAAAYTSTDSVTIAGVAAVAVASAPAIGQYSVAAGVYTFNSADGGKAAVIQYRYLVAPANYTIVLPNVVQFTVAPPAGSTAYATFQYFFVCRFVEDATEFNKFMDKLWNLNELGFRSVIQ